MKKITLLLGLAISTTLSFSQVILDVVSAPSCTNLEGTYTFYQAGELNGSSTDWSIPSMFIGSNSIQAQCVLFDDDGTTSTTGPYIGACNTTGVDDTGGNTTHNTNFDACDSTCTTQDLAGKIAVFYRGACEFGLKAFNAQKRGAIGAIIVNHTGDAVGMAGGDFGTNVTIPYAMVSEDDGNALIACLQGGGFIEVFYGSKVGLFPNDMATAMKDVVLSESFANPLSISQDSSEFNLDLGMWAYNVGQNPMNGVTFTATIEHAGAIIHSVTSSSINFPAPDTSYVDSQYVDLGNYGRNPSWLTGTYTLTYSINTTIADDAPADNVVVTQFKVTADNVYSKARVDGANEPIHTTAYSLNENITIYDDFETCIQFRSSNASRLKLMGMTYSCQPVGQTMAGELIEIRAYTWDDVFTDANDVAFPTGPYSLTQIGGHLDFFIDESENGVNRYQQFDEAGGAGITLVDNQRYLFCVYNASDALRVSYDAQIDYTSTVNNYLEFSAPVKTLPNGGSPEWFAAGFGYDVSPAITINMDLSPVGVTENISKISASPFPNPAANMLTVPVRKTVKGNVVLEVFDITGKLVLSEKSMVNLGKVQVNVASIPNGAYIFKTRFSDGSTDSFKIAVNR